MSRLDLEWGKPLKQADQPWEYNLPKHGIPPKGMYVVLSSAANPDFPEDDDEGNFEFNKKRPAQFVAVRSPEHAAQVVKKYIHDHDLGGGNWTGGHIFKDGKVVGYVGYNGRIWDVPQR